MGMIWDIIKAIPHVGVLLDKISVLDAKQAASDTEIAILKDTNREKDVQIKKLEKQVEVLTQEPDLHEIEIQIIKLLAQSSRTNEAAIQHSLNVPYAITVHHIARLKDRGYVCPVKVGATDFPDCALTKKGREFANENHLIEYPASVDEN